MSEPIPDKSPLIIAISTLLIVLPTTAISLRFISRHLSKAGLWWDDWVILLALVGLANRRAWLVIDPWAHSCLLIAF